jgi:hypothetical protein
LIRLPILRQGVPYYSLDVARVAHHRTREPFVEVSQANPGLIRRDLGKQDIARSVLQKFSTRELVDICSRAANIFTEDPADYISQVSATTGLPHVLVERNMLKIKNVFEHEKRAQRTDARD